MALRDKFPYGKNVYFSINLDSSVPFQRTGYTQIFNCTAELIYLYVSLFLFSVVKTVKFFLP